MPYFIYVIFKFGFVPHIDLNQVLSLAASFLFFNTTFFILSAFACYIFLAISFYDIPLIFVSFIVWAICILFLIIYYCVNKMTIFSSHFAVGLIFISTFVILLFFVYLSNMDTVGKIYYTKNSALFIVFILSIILLYFIFSGYNLKHKVIASFLMIVGLFAFYSPFSVELVGFGNFNSNFVLKDTKITNEFFGSLPDCKDNLDNPCKQKYQNSYLLLKNIHVISIDARGYWVQIDSNKSKNNHFLISNELVYTTNLSVLKEMK